MGYTWHHDEEFELVDSELHDLSRYIEYVADSFSEFIAGLREIE